MQNELCFKQIENEEIETQIIYETLEPPKFFTCVAR